jgi:hypothetical protein
LGQPLGFPIAGRGGFGTVLASTRGKETLHMPDAKQDTGTEPLEGATGEALDLDLDLDFAGAGAALTAPSHSLWDALAGYWVSPEPGHFMGVDFDPLRRSDEEDFSAEHGYEPGVEGRSEFEHGEFERWL